MDIKILRMTILISSAIVYLAIIFTIPLRRKLLLKRAGKLYFSAKPKSVVLQILIILCCGAILAILGFRELGLVGDIIVCLVSILGVAMGSAEVSLFKNCGIYENGFIGNGFYLPFSEIYSIPALNPSENSDEEKSATSSLKVITDKKGTVTFSYDSVDECALVIEKLREIKPSLGKKD